MRTTRLHKALVVMGGLALAAPLAPVPGAATDAWAERLPSFSVVVKQAKPAVVTVRVETRREMAGDVPGLPFDDPQLREFFERFFGGIPGMPDRRGTPPPDRRPRLGMGSGFIIDESGIIVTNNHVVDGAEAVTVVLEQGQEYEAQVVGTDEKTDLAVLRIEADEELPTIAWGDSDKIEVGDWVIAIGNPFGFGGTVTAGIVSARGRNLHSGPYDDFIQFDAPINRGNSGGPLFDQDGNVVGVNAAIFSPSGGNVGVGFAIPSNLARDVTAELVEEGHVERGWLGVSIQPVDDEVAESLGLAEARGALVANALEGGPAAGAGIEAGDVILEFNGTRIETLRDLTTTVAETEPGTAAEVTIWREGEQQTVSVDIARMEPQQAAVVEEQPEREVDNALLGLAVREGENGLIVTSVESGSEAARKGVQIGDVIMAVNQQSVATRADLSKAISEARANDRESVLVLLSREAEQRFVTLPVGAA